MGLELDVDGAPDGVLGLDNMAVQASCLGDAEQSKDYRCRRNNMVAVAESERCIDDWKNVNIKSCGGSDFS